MYGKTMVVYIKWYNSDERRKFVSRVMVSRFCEQVHIGCRVLSSFREF